MWSRSENQIKLLMIRHGATASNKEHRYLGITDEPLSEEGRQELYQARERNLYPEVEYVFASPMKRCLETAGILYPDQNPFVIPQWREMNFGIFEGKNYVELQNDVRYQAWIDSNGTLPFPQGESREEFIERCAQGLFSLQKQLCDMLREPNRKAVGMIVHGGTIMSLMSRFYGGEYFDYQVPNGGGYLCTVDVHHEAMKIIDFVRINV